MVLDFLLPLKSRIEKLLNFRNTPKYYRAKSFLLQLKLKDFDELPRKPVVMSTIPAEINVKVPSEIRWNSYGILTIEIIPQSGISNLTLDLSDLTRFFKVLRDYKPITSIKFPPLRKGIKIVEEVELIPKYKGEFTINLTFRWKNLRKYIPIKITVFLPKYESIKLLGHREIISAGWTIYDPAKRVFILKPKCEAPMREWINKHDPLSYWIAVCIINHSGNSIDCFELEFETSKLLKIKGVYVEGFEGNIPYHKERASKLGRLSMSYQFQKNCQSQFLGEVH